MKKRSHKRSSGSTRPLHWVSKERVTPMREAMKLAEPPSKCDKCGNKNIVCFEERISNFRVRMAHCSSGTGGCGKTWRLV